MKNETIILDSPITEEQWDAITDVDFDNTDRSWFRTKHGKEVEFVKRIRGRWKKGINENGVTTSLFCPECNYENKHWYEWNYCPKCGVDLREEEQHEC
jgi:hypothetical protein